MQIPGYLVTILEIREGGIHWRLRQRPRPREWCWITGAWATRAGLADDLSAQGSGLRARKNKGSPHAPEKQTPTEGTLKNDGLYYYHIPRSNTNEGGGGIEVTVTSEQHAQDDRTTDNIHRRHQGKTEAVRVCVVFPMVQSRKRGPNG